MTGTFVAYYRVSTQKQGRSGLGLEAQRNAVAEYLNGGRWQLLAEVTEIESGKNNARPKLAEALALCRIHKAKLVIARLDRLARNVLFVSNLMESGVDFVACDLPAANKLTIHILASVAEADAEAISHRTKVALAAAKRRGVVLGGDHGIGALAHKGAVASAKVRTEQARRRAVDLLPVIQQIKQAGASSLRAIAGELNARGILTAHGKEWTGVQVMLILRGAVAAS